MLIDDIKAAGFDGEFTAHEMIEYVESFIRNDYVIGKLKSGDYGVSLIDIDGSLMWTMESHDLEYLRRETAQTLLLSDLLCAIDAAD